jgi:D-glycero-D-manno-heptose 1,7-bisphosphate phosphatase
VSGAAGAVFLDRDGTLIEEVGYLDRVERVELYPWSIDAVRVLSRAGLRLILVSNQSGVARGFFTEAVVEEIHRHMASLLEAGGARIDAYYYCPHHPDGSVEGYKQRCACRKPGRGLVDRAIEEFGIDPAQSFVVGDRWVDVELAQAVGSRAVLVRTGYGTTEEQRPREGLKADAILDNVIGAASWILRELKSTENRPR